MKSLLVIGAALCSVASVLSFRPEIQEASPVAGTQFYYLQAKGGASLNNQYVRLIEDSDYYGLGESQAAATKFFVQKYEPNNSWGFVTANDSRQVALLGQEPAGVLLYMVRYSAETALAGFMEWSTFTMDNNVLAVKDGSTLTSRTFAAVLPSGSGSDWTLALYDGVGNTTLGTFYNLQAMVPLTLDVMRAGGASTSMARRALSMIV